MNLFAGNPFEQAARFLKREFGMAAGHAEPLVQYRIAVGLTSQRHFRRAYEGKTDSVGRDQIAGSHEVISPFVNGGLYLDRVEIVAYLDGERLEDDLLVDAHQIERTLLRPVEQVAFGVAQHGHLVAFGDLEEPFGTVGLIGDGLREVVGYQFFRPVIVEVGESQTNEQIVLAIFFGCRLVDTGGDRHVERVGRILILAAQSVYRCRPFARELVEQLRFYARNLLSRSAQDLHLRVFAVERLNDQRIGGAGRESAITERQPVLAVGQIGIVVGQRNADERYDFFVR